MPDYRTFYDKDFIGAWDLNDGDKTITMTKCIGGSLVAPGGRKSKKPVVYFQGSEKGFALNATNGKTIASLYGNMVEQWAGKKITLYKSTTRSPQGDGDVECIRVRPTVPTGKGRAFDDAGAASIPATEGLGAATPKLDSAGHPPTPTSPSPQPAGADAPKTRTDTLRYLCTAAGTTLPEVLGKAEVTHADEMAQEDYDSAVRMLNRKIAKLAERVQA